MTDEAQLWVVTLLARSAVRLRDDRSIYIRAAADSTVPVRGVRLRNQVAVGTDGSRFVGSLVAEAAGVAAGADAAVALLANLANTYYQVMAVAANAAVDHPEDLVAYAPPAGADDVGRFVVQRHSQPRAPAAAVRDLDAADLMALLQAISRHPNEDRLHRAMAHFRTALGEMDHQNWVTAAESLYIAVENLGRIVHLRLLDEAGLPHNGEGKHLLALRHGFEPTSDSDRSHLGRLDTWERVTHVCGGDESTYRGLVKASDGFEHGYVGFDVVRSHADAVAADAFRYVRHAILREAGLPADSPLFDPRYDSPLGDWRPVVEMSGTYTDSAPVALPALEGDDVTQPWPHFTGPTITPLMVGVDDADDGRRMVSLRVDGDASSLTKSQTLTIDTLRWLLPTSGGNAIRPVSGDDLTVVLNGEDVTDVHVR